MGSVGVSTHGSALGFCSHGVEAEQTGPGNRDRYPAVAATWLHATASGYASRLLLEPALGAGRPAATVAAQRVAEREPAAYGWTGVALQARWLARLSCALRTSLVEATLTVWGCIRPPPVGPARDGFLLLELLPFAVAAGGAREA